MGGRRAPRAPTVTYRRPTSLPAIAKLHPLAFRHSIGVLALLSTVPNVTLATATVQPLPQSQQPIANFAFASQLGAGVYSVNGRTVQIYRLPFDWELRPPTEDGVGLKITLPVTLGFYGYQVQDVVTEGLPGSVDTYSFLPGLEVSRLFGPQWRLATFGEVGIAAVHGQSGRNLIYDAGVRARYEFPMGGFRARYGAELLYAASQVPDQVKDSMSRLSNGIDLLHPTAMSMRGEFVDVGPYFLNEWYFKRPTPLASSSGPPMTAAQWEVGFTIGTVRTSYLWNIPIPRIGFGYRFGSDLSIVRLVFGSAF
jgi:hypothetical protein